MTLLSRAHPHCPSKGQKVKKGKAQATVRSEGCGSDFIPPPFSLGHRWIDSCGSCPWPHCNPSCPTIRDQFTGQEMNVAQFLMHMGFDVQTVAQQQGLEPSKLLGMLSSGS